MNKRFLILSVAILLLANIFVWQLVFIANDDLLTVSFLDVGQGDAVFIEAPSGNQVLVDAGRGGEVLTSLGEVMPFFDRSIDMLIATHPDADHIGGFPHILRRFEISAYLSNDKKSESDVYKTLLNELDKEDPKMFLADRGMRIWIDEDIFLDLLYPAGAVSSEDANEGSIFLQLVYGDTAFMLTGDASTSVENYVTSIDGKRLKSDVLKLGHHGSKTSSGAIFLASVLPSYSIVSAGKDNRYGHPNNEVIERVLEFESEVLSTAELGTITFQSDGEQVYLR